MSPHTPTMDTMRKVVAVATMDAQRIFIWRRGDMRILKLLIDARGDWVDPVTADLSGQMLSRHAASLRSKYSIPVQTECVRDAGGFHNRHRLTVPVSLNEGGPANV